MRARSVTKAVTPARKSVRVRRPARTWRERVADAPPRRRRRSFRSDISIPQPKLRAPKASWNLAQLQGSRLAAALLSGVLLLVMAQFILNDAFYVYQVEATGANRLTAAMLFEQSGAAGYNIFWVDPNAVRQNLLANPYVRSAAVQVALPNRLLVMVEEREPRLAWMVGETLLWADESGALLPPTDEVLILPTLQDDTGALRVSHTQISPTTVAAVLELHDLVPSTLVYRYTDDLGLHFASSGQTTVYLGDERGMREKVALLNALRVQLAVAGTEPQLIDLRYEGSAYYR